MYAEMASARVEKGEKFEVELENYGDMSMDKIQIVLSHLNSMIELGKLESAFSRRLTMIYT